MELAEFVASVPDFAALTEPERILHFGWFLHTHRKLNRFSQALVRECYDRISMDVPNLSQQFDRLSRRKPKALLQDSEGYYLEHTRRKELDQRYGMHETTVALSNLLNGLPGKISNEAERIFLSEAVICYRHRAFRASIVMTWNLTYDHLLRWVISDPQRVASFNRNIVGRVGPKRAAAITIAQRQDFEELKEGEVIDICGTAGLFDTENTKKVLEIQLTKRNLAAHPSLIVIGAPEAEDTISSLINNVVLILDN